MPSILWREFSKVRWSDYNQIIINSAIKWEVILRAKIRINAINDHSLNGVRLKHVCHFRNSADSKPSTLHRRNIFRFFKNYANYRGIIEIQATQNWLSVCFLVIPKWNCERIEAPNSLHTFLATSCGEHISWVRGACVSWVHVLTSNEMNNWIKLSLRACDVRQLRTTHRSRRNMLATNRGPSQTFMCVPHKSTKISARHINFICNFELQTRNGPNPFKCDISPRTYLFYALLNCLLWLHPIASFVELCENGNGLNGADCRPAKAKQQR